MVSVVRPPALPTRGAPAVEESSPAALPPLGAPPTPARAGVSRRGVPPCAGARRSGGRARDAGRRDLVRTDLPRYAGALDALLGWTVRQAAPPAGHPAEHEAASSMVRGVAARRCAGPQGSAPDVRPSPKSARGRPGRPPPGVGLP